MSIANKNEICVEIKSVAEVFSIANLKIPNYQRPYKWGRKNIRDLFYDIRKAIDDNFDEYRIGSIILHNKDANNFDIVDGQQRLLSLALLYNLIKADNLPVGVSNLLSNDFVEISCQNAKNNYEEWQSLFNLIKDENYKNQIVDYFFNKCKMSVIIIPVEMLSVAFQLFDSQNNRGKALEPHDLLKAYHLRAIDESKQNETMVSNWESFVSDTNFPLKELFDKHLYRIRKWVNGHTGLNKKQYGSELRFSEKFIDDFKGVSLNTEYPYLDLYKALNKNKIEFPISLNMPIIDGQMFFKYIEYSYQLYKDNIENNYSNKYPEHKYIRNINLYNNLFCSFIDRFGKDCAELKEVEEMFFVWAFYPRIIARMLYDSSIANYAAGGEFQRKKGYQKMFQLLSTSTSPRDFISKIDMEILENYTADELESMLSIKNRKDDERSKLDNNELRVIVKKLTNVRGANYGNK
ncbi:MAG: DUF262 domain-containing protein [Clostridia bacterium]|nr:DUF262 domain-containing protein [Clostridia bacterium]